MEDSLNNLKVGDIVRFKNKTISGEWEVVKIYKNGDVKLVKKNTDCAIGMPVEQDILEKVEK